MRKRKTAKTARRAGALQWSETAPGVARAIVVGNRRVLIENYRALIEYSEARVRLSARGGELLIAGEGLEIAELRAESLIVRGRIDTVEMPPVGETSEDDR